MNWTVLINPFRIIPDKLLLLLGMISFIVGCYISHAYRMIYDGIWDAHEARELLFSQAFTANTVDVIVVAILLIVFGRIINPKTRMIDILNTALISRIPIYLTVPLAGIPMVKSVLQTIMDHLKVIEHLKFQTFEVMVLTVFSSAVLLLLGYSIALMVNGFRHATHVKKVQHYLVFAALIIIAELLSKWIVSMI